MCTSVPNGNLCLVTHKNALTCYLTLCIELNRKGFAAQDRFVTARDRIDSHKNRKSTDTKTDTETGSVIARRSQGHEHWESYWFSHALSASSRPSLVGLMFFRVWPI